MSHLFRVVAFLTVLGIRVTEIGGKCDCFTMRTHRMKSADCHKLDLHHFPTCLDSDVQILEMSYNRIREVRAEDLNKFSSLRFLYLNENMITRIDPEAVRQLSDLELLDLSYNAFSSTIPKEIFQLPSLRTLYLSQNQNINVIDILEKTHVSSPLVKLDISYNNFEELQRLPDLKIISTLTFYNVSGMELILRPRDTAGLCNLKYFIAENVTANFENPCDCFNIQSWFKERGVKFTPFFCSGKISDCPYEIPQEDLSIYNQCQSKFEEIVYQSKMNQTLLIVGSVLLVCLLVAALLLWRYTKKKKSRKAKIFESQKMLRNYEDTLRCPPDHTPN